LHYVVPKRNHSLRVCPAVSLDMHTGGEPLRVFVSGLPTLDGNTVLAKWRFFRDHYDYIRTGTMWEPRGHADMYAAVLTP
jgi:proline racemase